MKNESLEIALERVQMPKENHPEKVRAFAFQFVTKSRGKFTSEDIWDAYVLAGNPEPEDRRVIGPFMRNFRRTGIIEPTGEYTEYEDKKSHNRPSRVWVRSIQHEQFEAKEIIGKQARLF